DKTTYAREKGRTVVMLDIKKRSGKNTIEAANKVRDLVQEAREDYFPRDLDVTIASASSSRTLYQVDDLVDNIIFGILLVV
ncbi:efflux RND transporter permease subunit, partial [Robiginitalea biformata]|uniref:efflux RND transporter permease subunit n=1 Tax=Robiginitalea biformata TaxID=252307 RepID=UPI003D3252CA